MAEQDEAITSASARRDLERLMLDHAQLQNPYALLAWLREHDPVANANPLRFVTRYEDVLSCYRDERLSRNRAAVAESAAHSAEGHPDEVLQRARLAAISMLINQDEPNHRRIRKILESTFTPRQLLLWKGRIESITADLIARVAGKTHFDFLRELAYPLPERVICELMGVPYEDHALWGAWTEAIVSAARTHEPSPEKKAAVDAAQRNFYLYFKELVGARRQHLGDDLVSIMIRAESEGDRLNETELLGSLQMLISAGHETTANLMGNGMYTLLRFPEQYELLRADSGLVPAAVEEMLRYESPAHWSLPREATVDVQVGAAVIPRGCPVLMALNAANRDPTVFEDPERFDIRRKTNRHIAFAAGPHFCLGNLLARHEAQAMFRAVVTRLPRLELVQPPRFKSTFVRALDCLPVRVLSGSIP